MENIECLNLKMLKILEEIKKLQEINDENKKQIEKLQREYKILDKELDEKSSCASVSMISDTVMSKCVGETPLVTSLLFSVDDNGVSDQIKDHKSKWDR